MATVTGTLESVVTGTAEPGSVVIALCGYGSYIPRSVGISLIARPASQGQDIPVDPEDGTFEAEIAGNDVIEPAGTYYTVTIKDANGDIVQVSAYQFLDSTDYDLNDTEPFDPAQPPPPIPAPIENILEILAPDDGMVFDGSTMKSFKTTLSAPVTQPVFQNMVPGNLYTFIIEQDATGGWDFVWAANVKNPMPISGVAGSTSVQTFVADEFENLLSISAGTYQ